MDLTKEEIIDTINKFNDIEKKVKLIINLCVEIRYVNSRIEYFEELEIGPESIFAEFAAINGKRIPDEVLKCNKLHIECIDKCTKAIKIRER